MSGINRYEGKDKRRQRMRNRYAKDLRDPKWHQRVVPVKRETWNKYYVELDSDNDE